MLTPKNIALRVELIAKEIFSLRKEPLPKHFSDWNIANNYVATIFELLNTHYRNTLPDEVVAFVRRYADFTGKSILEIGVEAANGICIEFQEIIKDSLI